MDPYLEQYWGDFHLSMITYSREAIQPELPGGLVARIGERVLVEFAEGQGRDIVPDVRVVEHGRREEPGPRLSNGVAVAEPLVVYLAQDEPVRQGFIEIIDILSGRRVVTVIEVLSPSNKLAGPGREQYVKKQEELRAGGVSLVELDLLRTGSRVLSVPFNRLPESHRTPYAACVRRGWRPFEVEFYRIPLRERLPAIAIPLRRDDRDVPLDLQAVFDRCYEVACYGDVVEYRARPEPPLQPDDAKWADALLREKGLR
jgi:hypothetical protein